MKFIDLETQLAQAEIKITDRINSVLEHCQFINGPEINELEQSLASRVGRKYCSTVANGTDALVLSLKALGVGPGDYVITTSFSFFASAEAISLTGATPIFIDIDPESFNISPAELSTFLSSCTTKPKAIVTVDLFGLPAQYDEILDLARKYNIYIVEDAAQGFGGKLQGKPACSFGDISTTSFFPAKPLGCYGDGGAVFTDNEEIFYKIESLKNHGKGSHKYENIRIGTNSRLDTLQAAILLEKLKIFDRELESRIHIAKYYNENLDSKFLKPKIYSDKSSAWALYTIKCKNRDRIKLFLDQNNIPSGIYYPIPLPNQPAFKQQFTTYPATESASSSVLSLPMHPYLTKDELDIICGTVNKAWRN